MDSQKLENQLNLALDSTTEERERSGNLNVGYNGEDNTWELIVRYTGSLDRIRQLGVQVVELLNNYAILTVPESLIDVVAASNEIIYIEKPKRLNFAIYNGKRVSCINQVQETPFSFIGSDGQIQVGLHGFGCIVCVIDSGIDYENDVFIDENGNTRILELWDQTVTRAENPPPDGYYTGALFTSEDINEALRLTGNNRLQRVPSIDRSGHGTAVASIAAGNFVRNKSSAWSDDSGIATRSELIVVKLGNPREEFFPRTSELMQAIDFCVRRGLYYGRPIAINLSFGNNYGSHDGTSLLATYIDSVSNVGRSVIVAGTGNEGASGSHTGGSLIEGQEEIVELAVGRYEPSLNLQIWKSYGDIFHLEIVSPSGISTGILGDNLGAYKYRLGNTQLLVYYGEPSPYSPYQEIYVEFVPAMVGSQGEGLYIDSGVWKINLISVRIIDGRYDMWLPGDRISTSTSFLRPTPDITLTIPSTARSVISVGAYDPLNFSYADFSGRGFTRATNQIKPDLVAPGVNISCAAVGGGMVQRTGTSFATPFVTGSAALMMEWGIVRGNDPYLYGEKVRAYMIRGARPLDGFTVPSPQIGWGALCLRDSLPVR